LCGNAFNQKTLRKRISKVVKRGDVIGASGTFFDGPNTSFNVGDMFVFPTDVQLRFQVGCDGTKCAFKFGVAKYMGNLEATFPIEAVDPVECLDQRLLLAVVEYLDGYEPNFACRLVPVNSLGVRLLVAILCKGTTCTEAVVCSLA
jgi:hypothetical protein